MPLLAIYSTIELVLSFIGTGIAGTLYYAHKNSIDLPCTSGGGCSLVENSHWSYFLGLPVSLLGAAVYVALALLSVVKLNATKPKLAAVVRFQMLGIAGMGFIFSWYLQYVAAVDIGAFCIYCRSSAITMTLIFLTVLGELLFMRRAERAVISSAPQEPALKT